MKPPGRRGPRRTSQQRDISTAQIQAVAALFKFLRAAIRTVLKRRSHRAPTDAKVRAALATIPRDAVASLVLHVLRQFERRIGKPSRKWTTSERRAAATYAYLVFDERRLAVERPKGRPRARRGIIGAELASKPLASTKRGWPKEVERIIVPWMRGERLGAWTKREENKGARDLRKPSDAIAYIKAWTDEDPENIMNTGPVPRGAWGGFIENFSLDANLKDALKQHYSRQLKTKRR